MNTLQSDMAYQILVQCSEDSDSPVSASLLLDIYKIQKEHQFERDRSVSSELMQKRILLEIEQMSSSDDSDNS
jgi:hypothetical protein